MKQYHFLSALAAGLLITAGLPAQDEMLSDSEIEASVSELEALISLPEQARLGREADEDLENPRNLFESEEVRRALLGEDPRFIYIPEGSDPMIIPWVRASIVAGELLSDADKIFRDGQARGDKDAVRRALPKLQEISRKYPEAPQVEQAAKLMVTIQSYLSEEDPTNRSGFDPLPEIANMGEDSVDLPPWIASNTTGVLLDLENPSESLVLIGDSILSTGDNVERFPSITIKEIRAQQVVFNYQGREFLVPVRSN